MTKPIRIAVLSDHHIDTAVDDDNWELAKAAFKAAAAEKPDHVVIAGDLFDCSTAMERDRDQVEKYLRKLGLWHRDKLTIVVGNHDIFHTPHRGGKLHMAAELLQGATADAQESYEGFCDWAGELVRPRDRLSGADDLFPIEKKLGFVHLWAADTTGVTTRYSSNGYWPKDDHTLLLEAAADADVRSVLAIHHPPFEDDEQPLGRILRGDFNLGFVKKELRRLERFSDHAKLDAIVCGHIHAMDEDDEDDDPWYWEIGDDWACEVHCVGRTGGVHDATPTFGILTVPEDVDEDMEWDEIEM